MNGDRGWNLSACDSDRGQSSCFTIRRATLNDQHRLVDIWWRSAKATHRFLSLSQLEELLPEVRALRLESLDTWVLCESSAEAVGFVVMDGRTVDALFLAPESLRRGGGSLLLHKVRSLAGPLRVDVNEQNVDALKFYLAQGFVTVGRSPVDTAGRPYPILHLEETD